MKSVFFFCVIFLSMLTVFLLATGEVQRWFTDTGSGFPEFERVRADDDAENLLMFPWWDTENGRVGFRIRAELNQEDLGQHQKIDDISQLTLRNGVLEIPHEGLEVSPSEGAEATAPDAEQSIVVEFDTAEWSKERKNVLLRSGKGRTEDGYEFQFETLSFAYQQGDDHQDSIVRSDRPVSIENEAFSLSSPAGLEGRLVAGELRSIRFLPPVTAKIDPSRAPGFAPGLAAEGGDKENEKEGGHASESGAATQGGKDAKEKRGFVVVTSQGPLDLERLPGASASAVRDGEHTAITFRDDVVIRSAPVSTATKAAAASGSRFECQLLELFFVKRGSRVVPDGARATWPGGRVKAYFQPEGGRDRDLYVIDGERLEWRTTAGADGDPASAVQEAFLLGRPTLTGGAMQFEAERATLGVTTGHVLLARVSGTFRRPEPKRPKAHGAGTEEQRRSPFPSDWNVEADEIEFVFDAERRLSHFVARAEDPGGLRLVSRESEDGVDGSAERDAAGMSLDATHLRYDVGERVVTISGKGGDKPVVKQGPNEMKAEVLKLLLAEEVAVFENDVHAIIGDPESFAALRGEPPTAEPQPANGEPESAETKNQTAKENRSGLGRLLGDGGQGVIELHAASLRIGGADDRIGALSARGTPVRVEIAGRRPRVLEAAKLDLLDGQVILEGDVNRRARLEVGDARLQAGRVRFEELHLTAILEESVSLQLRKSGKRLTVRGGRAEVQFYSQEEMKGRQESTGPLRDLDEVKLLHVEGDGDDRVEFAGGGDAEEPTLRARSQTLLWDGETRELRLFGDGEQEIRLASDRLDGPVFAREILYRAEQSLIELRGSVRGEIAYRVDRERPSKSGRRQKLSERTPTHWKLETSRLEIRLGDGSGDGTSSRGGSSSDDASRDLFVESVHAREWVHLKNAELQLQLLGDELRFDAGSNKIHVFSPAGRPQTFQRGTSFAAPTETVAGQDESGGAPAPAWKTDKIIAQEIWLLPYSNARAQLGSPSRWLLISFHHDVKATFHPAGETLLSRSEGAWKLDAEDELTLQIDPERDAAHAVVSARAVGNVVFKAGDNTATAETAEYEGRSRDMILRGRPARVTYDGTTVEKRVFRLVYQTGGGFKLESRPHPRRS